MTYAGHAPVLTAEQSAVLVGELSARLYLTAKAVCGFVMEHFGLCYTPQAMAKLLCRLGFVRRRPECIPAQVDAEAQRICFVDTLAPLMAAANPTRPLYSVDAPAYDAHPACGRIRRGQMQTPKNDHGRANVTLNGALSAAGFLCLVAVLEWAMRKMLAWRIQGRDLQAAAARAAKHRYLPPASQGS